MKPEGEFRATSCNGIVDNMNLGHACGGVKSGITFPRGVSGTFRPITVVAWGIDELLRASRTRPLNPRDEASTVVTIAATVHDPAKQQNAA